MKFKSYPQLLSYLYSFIPDRLSLKFSGVNGILRTKYFLRLLDNPQEKIKLIHVAGTSGKGSTAFLISALLKQHGFKVGLQVSPHLIDIRERFQINNILISEKEFSQRITEITPMIEKARMSQWGQLTFFEILVGLAFYIFLKNKVEFAVMETGLGGLYDGTNVVNNPNKFSVITRIGLDHQWILGKTLPEIARQKAGIIQRGNTVIALQQRQSVVNVFKKQSEEKQAALFLIKKNQNFSHIKLTKKNTTFNFSFKNFYLNKICLRLLGEHQVENASVALAALFLLSKKYQFKINETIIRNVLAEALFPGRMEIYKTKREIIIDGAHNPQKMRALTVILKKIYHGQKFDFFISFSRSKDQIPTLRNMLRYIVSLSDKIYITDFVLFGQDSFHQSVDLKKIITLLKKLKFSNYQVIANNRKTLTELINQGGKPLIITGSLYFIGGLYKNLKKII